MQMSIDFNTCTFLGIPQKSFCLLAVDNTSKPFCLQLFACAATAKLNRTHVLFAAAEASCSRLGISLIFPVRITLFVATLLPHSTFYLDSH